MKKSNRKIKIARKTKDKNQNKKQTSMIALIISHKSSIYHPNALLFKKPKIKSVKAYKATQIKLQPIANNTNSTMNFKKLKEISAITENN